MTKANDERTYTLLHVRSPDYTSAVATGVIVTGPTDDGFVHLHFFRETQRILNEDVPVLDADDNNLKLNRAEARLKVNLQREEVSTISIPDQVFAELAKGLVQVSKTLP